MDFNAPNFEGFVIPQNNQPTKSHILSMSTSSSRARTKFLEVLEEMSIETTTIEGVEVASTLKGTPDMLEKSANCQTFYELLPPPPSAWSNVGHKNKMMTEGNMVGGVETFSFLKRTPVGESENQRTLYDLLPPPSRARPNDGYEQDGQQGFNHFHMLNPLLRANQQQMFNSSSSSLEVKVDPFINKNGGNSEDFTAYQKPPSSTRSCIGDGSEKLNIYAGEGRVITPSQLMELQDQSLIYNYISSNMVVPPHLLNNICLCSHCVPASNSTSSPINAATWGSLRQGYAGSSVDLEPGRCRRSDGKKWRCSKDAVVDEKYCEKHRNRGRIRQRSRKTTTRGRRAAAGNTGPPLIGTISGSSPVRVQSDVSFVNIQQEDQLKKNSKPAFDNSSVAALFNW